MFDAIQTFPWVYPKSCYPLYFRRCLGTVSGVAGVKSGSRVDGSGRLKIAIPSGDQSWRIVRRDTEIIYTSRGVALLFRRAERDNCEGRGNERCP